jgi:hypothetical protein
MASNVAAMDLMKQPYQVIISWKVLNLKMKKYYSIKYQNSQLLRMFKFNLFINSCIEAVTDITRGHFTEQTICF